MYLNRSSYNIEVLLGTLKSLGQRWMKQSALQSRGRRASAQVPLLVENGFNQLLGPNLSTW
jgi:hypothetical protein